MIIIILKHPLLKKCNHSPPECRVLISCQSIRYIWAFPKIEIPQNGWFIMENPIRMDDLGVPLFSETPI